MQLEEVEEMRNALLGCVMFNRKINHKLGVNNILLQMRLGEKFINF
jgi:hypothetical protein